MFKQTDVINKKRVSRGLPPVMHRGYVDMSYFPEKQQEQNDMKVIIRKDKQAEALRLEEQKKSIEKEQKELAEKLAKEQEKKRLQAEKAEADRLAKEQAERLKKEAKQKKTVSQTIEEMIDMDEDGINDDIVDTMTKTTSKMSKTGRKKK